MSVGIVSQNGKIRFFLFAVFGSTFSNRTEKENRSKVSGEVFRVDAPDRLAWPVKNRG
jgi:hypothetical protein